MKTVLLSNETVGKVKEAEVGQIVTVTLHDENGMEIQATGEVVEILVDN